jgi:type I restriction enzyme S subunit
MKTTKHNITNTAEPIKPGYKKTPVGVIPEDWEVKKLDNIFEFKNGVNGDKSKYGEGIKFINVMEVIYNNRITSNMISGSIMIPERQKNLFLVKKGDVLFNRTSETQDEIALAALYDDEEEVVFGGFVIRGRPKKNILINNFKKYCFDSSMMRKQIISKGQGAIRFNIGQSDLRKVNLPIPPLPEQEAIADCLSTWDKGIEKLSALIAAKKEQKKGLMQGLFSGELKVENGQLIQAKDGEDFTKEWKEVKLGEIAYCLDNLRVPLNSEERDKMKGEIPYCGANGVIDYVNDFVIDDDIILMAEDGGYFDEYETRPIAYRMKGKCWVNNHAHILKAKENFNHSFLFYSLVHKNVIPYISGGTRAKLNKKHLLQIKINAPVDSEEQTAIAEILQTADKEIELLEKKLEAFKTQKKGLMQVLLTGEKRLV